MANLSFNAATVEPASTFDALPKGKYLAIVIASELKPTKQRNGEYLQLTLEIIDGPGKGRKIFDRLNIRNSNKVAEDIAQRQLSALCHAVGVIELDDSDQLHNIPVTVELGIEDSDDYGPQNRVKSYSSAGGQPPVTLKAAPKPAAEAPAANTPVWKKKAAGQ
jgi:hypothetical protein